MPTPPAPTSSTPAPTRSRLTLEDGPLADAVTAVERAVAGIETARAALVARRHDVARVFQSELADHAGDATLGEDLRAVVAALYWDHPSLRLADLSSATGLSTDRIHELAGPRRVEVACGACGAPTEVLQARRGSHPMARCPDCRRPDPPPLPYAEPWSPPYDDPSYGERPYDERW